MNKTKLLLFVLLFTISSNLYGQILTQEEIDKKFDYFHKYVSELLANKRYLHQNKQQDMMLYGPYWPTNGNIYNMKIYADMDRDLTVNAWYDQEMKDRLIQLLNNEYMPGELDSVVSIKINNSNYLAKSIENLKLKQPKRYQRLYDEFISKEKKLKKRDLYFPDSCYQTEYSKQKSICLSKYQCNMEDVFMACWFLDDERIMPLLIKLLDDPNYTEYLSDIRAALIHRGYKPIIDELLTANKYDDRKTTTELNQSIHNLHIIRNEESIFVLSDYLLSDRIDSTYEVWESRTGDRTNHLIESPIYLYAYSIIIRQVTNPEMYIKANVSYPFDRDPKIPRQYDEYGAEFITKEQARICYDWLHKNLGNYQLLKKW